MIFALAVIGQALAIEANGYQLFGTSGDPSVFPRIGSAYAGRSGSWDALMGFGYASAPLAEQFPWGRETVLDSVGTVALGGGYSFGGLRIDAVLPFHPFAEDQAGSFGATGDMRLGVMVPAFGAKGYRPALAIQGNLWAPTGDETRYLGSLGPKAGIAALVQQDFGPVGLVAMLGAQAGFPEVERNLSADIGPLLGLGLSYQVNDAISSMLELTSQSDIVSQANGSSLTWPVEASLSGRYRLPAGAWASLGGSAGLTDGVGAAEWRATLSLGWTYTKPAPPAMVAPVDPNLDTDGDGIRDVEDKCDDMAETVDGVEDQDGCPEFDGDADGVPFEKDECPREAIHPEQDPRYSDGCPKVAEFAGDRIVITEAIFFREARAELLPSAIPVLEAVRAVIADHPEIPYFLVEGHTNTNGSDAYNARLSDARAFAVMDYLVQHGVEPKRLLSKGFGESRLLVAEDHADAEAINRRVEFRVAKIEDLPVDARTLAVPEDVRR